MLEAVKKGISSLIKEIDFRDVVEYGSSDQRINDLFHEVRYEAWSSPDEREKTEGLSFSDLTIAHHYFGRFDTDSIENEVSKIKCNWLILVEKFQGNTDSKVAPIISNRSREEYIVVLRRHDLILHNKLEGDSGCPIFLFRRCKNPRYSDY